MVARKDRRVRRRVAGEPSVGGEWTDCRAAALAGSCRRAARPSHGRRAPSPSPRCTPSSPSATIDPPPISAPGPRGSSPPCAATSRWRSPRRSRGPRRRRAAAGRPARRDADRQGPARTAGRRRRRQRRVTDEPTRGLSTVAEPPPWEREGRARPTWGFDEGDEIAPGRTVLRRLGGGRRYEVFLVWDDHRLAVLVAKVLRPDQAATRSRCASSRARRRRSTRLAHPVDRARIRRGDRRPLPAPADRAPRGADAVRPDPRRRAGWRSSRCCRSGCTSPSALHYLAAEGMVHLDVKPENIVMGAPPRLIDLSVARPVDEARAPAHADRHRRLHGARAVRSGERRRSARRRTCSASPRRSGTRSAAGARSRARARSASRSAPAIPRCPAASPRRARRRSSARGSRATPPTADRGGARRRARAAGGRAAAPVRARPSRARGVYAAGWGGESADLAANCPSRVPLADPSGQRLPRRPTQPGFRRRRPRPGWRTAGSARRSPSRARRGRRGRTRSPAAARGR